MKVKTPYLTYADIGKESKNFLKQYWPTFELPIPIEKIVDVDMGIHIDTFSRLYKNYGLNGFLTADRTTIYVDETQYDQFYKKCRYTLAHELGHYILHKECYQNLSFESINEYIEWRLSIPPEDLDWLETQADWFAEQVLVPRDCLKIKCLEVVNKYQTKLSKIAKSPDDFWSYASNEIARYFDVNPPVIEIRIKREDFTKEIKLF